MILTITDTHMFLHFLWIVESQDYNTVCYHCLVEKIQFWSTSEKCLKDFIQEFLSRQKNIEDPKCFTFYLFSFLFFRAQPLFFSPDFRAPVLPMALAALRLSRALFSFFPFLQRDLANRSSYPCISLSLSCTFLSLFFHSARVSE